MFRTTFPINTADKTFLISSDYSLKISRTSFKPLTPGSKKGHTYLANLPLRRAGLFKYVCPFFTTSIKRLTNTIG